MPIFEIPKLTDEIINGKDKLESGIITNSGGSGGSGTNYGRSDPNVFVFNAIVIFLYIISIITALTFVWAGVRYMTAGGDAEKAESAKKIIFGSIIGMLIILGSLAFFRYTVDVLNKPTESVEDASQRMNKVFK